MPKTITQLEQLYTDTKRCAALVGLRYVPSDMPGVSRRRQGNGFRYLDNNQKPITDQACIQRFASLAIPPAWQEVWICPQPDGHIQATGIDEKGRKQYIYHQKWRTMRDLIKFYRLLLFAQALPKIRSDIETKLQKSGLPHDRIVATMLWLLDNTYIRIGNEHYYRQNESVGLTTLTDKNLVVAGSVVTLSFTATSGKPQQITFEDRRIARILQALRAQRGERLFSYRGSDGLHGIESSDINAYLHDLTGIAITAKDFRTWGGTLLAFDQLTETTRVHAKPAARPEKTIIHAVDTAAHVLGNTRSVARSSYVHPDILELYGSRDFAAYYALASQKRARRYLDKREAELASFLEQLFEYEFQLVKNG